MSQYSEFFLVGSPKYATIASALRLRSYGSWLTEELWLRDAQNKKRAEFSMKAIRLARRIAARQGISEDEAFDLLQTDGPERQEVLGDFTEEAASLFALLPSPQEQFEELVTKFFQNRGEVKKGTDWTTTADWSREDTGKLTKAMLDAVEAFMATEEGVAATNGEEDDAPKEQG
jgi:hypothetical protein